MLRVQISSAMDGVRTRQQRGICFSPGNDVDIDTFLACDSICCHVFCLCFSKTRTVQVVPFCAHRRSTLVGMYSGRHSTRGMRCCFWFYFNSQKMEVGSKAKSIIPKTLQVIWQRYRDVVAHFLYTLWL